MHNQNILPKKDIILLNGTDDLRIDMIGQLLLKYFDKYEYFPRKYFDRQNISPRKIIKEYIRKGKKLIINSSAHYRSPRIFKVLFTSGDNSGKNNVSLLKISYNHVVNLDNKHSDEDVIQEMIVQWGCWLDDRKVTKPI